MSKIFINYRRDDSAAYAGRLYDRLANHFGRDHIFMDIDQIGPGEDFLEVIQEKLKSVQIAVVMLGKHWLDITDDSGQRRLDNPDDFVRVEIAALLERKIRVIPVLVGGAGVPKSTQLPECLTPLVRRNAYEISDKRFHADVDKLIQALEKIIGAQMPPQSTDPPKIPELQISMPASKDNFPKQTNTNNTVAPQSDKPSSHGLTIILGAIGILLVVVGLFSYFSWTAKDAHTNLAQPAISESDELLTKQPVIEQSNETRSSLTKQAVIEQPSEAKPPLKKKPVVDQSNKTRLSFEPEMVRISPGKFLMGSPENESWWRSSHEGPQHEVTIAYAFEISKYEITFDEYDHFAKATSRSLPDDSGWGRDKRAVINVSFNDAQAYVQWLSQQTRKKYRLPTEAEWEYAARAGTQTAYWWGNDIGENNTNCRNCVSEWNREGSPPIGSFKPNAFGLHDSAGGVLEWTQDCWHENYSNAPVDGSAWQKANGGDCSLRVFRGGAWYIISPSLRSAVRGRTKNTNATNGLGFRIARDF